MVTRGSTRRVHIIGGPGSGKSTLAAQLGKRMSVSVYDLDAVAYEGGAGPKRELSARHADVERIAQTPGWVTEGIYLWWCDPLAEKADRIVWLDVPWRVAVYRIVRRHIVLSLAGTNRHPGVKKLARFAWETRRYYLTESTTATERANDDDDGAVTRAATEIWLKRYGNKVLRSRMASDLKSLTSVALG